MVARGKAPESDFDESADRHISEGFGRFPVEGKLYVEHIFGRYGDDLVVHGYLYGVYIDQPVFQQPANGRRADIGGDVRNEGVHVLQFTHLLGAVVEQKVFPCARNAAVGIKRRARGQGFAVRYGVEHIAARILHGDLRFPVLTHGVNALRFYLFPTLRGGVEVEQVARSIIRFARRRAVRRRARFGGFQLCEQAHVRRAVRI